MSKVIRVKIWNSTGIPEAMRKYCDDHGISMNEFAKRAIAEKLAKMDVHSMTIAEIEAIERCGTYE